MKKLFLTILISLSFGSALAKSNELTNDSIFALEKATSGLELVKTDKDSDTRMGFCTSPSSGCYTGWVGGCLLINGGVVYCILL